MSGAGTCTFLFTDLVGSTELLERLGDDAAETVRRTHFRLLRDAVAAAGGHEVKNLGDGLMVVFNSAVEAVACAVAVQQTVHRHNRFTPGPALEVKVGLHVGEPIRDEEDYFGTAVVVARRLCESAGGGQILASEIVRQLVGTRGDFTFAPLVPRTLKGFSEPIAVCEVRWGPEEGESAVPLPPWLAVADPTAFVGRELEMKRLAEAFEHVAEGALELVMVVGEPGIGKSRLTAEFCRRIHQDGAVVLFGRCDEAALCPYQPFVEALSHYVATCPLSTLRSCGETVAADLARLVPRVSERWPGLAPVPGDGETDRYRLFAAVTAVLAAASTESPLVLVLDDVHWADRPTLLLLRHLVRSPESAGLLVLGTYRDTDVDATHPLTETLADLRRERRLTRLPLRGLDEDEVAALLGAATHRDLDRHAFALARAVRRETAGNPFFVGEVVRHLAETGAAADTVGELGGLGIPESVKDIINRRLSRLGPAAGRALSVAAVAGPQFSLSVLEQVGDLAADDLLDVLDEAVRAKIIAEVPGTADRYSFSHALIRETLYEGLSHVRRARLHHRIGTVLEALAASGGDPPLGELAYHFSEAAAGNTAKALEYAMRAAAAAMEQLAYEDAVGHYQRALRVLRLDDDPVRVCDVLLALGEAQNRSGLAPAARATLQEAAACARRAGDAERLAAAALGCAVSWTAGTEEPDLIELLDEALHALGDGDSPRRARLLGRLGMAVVFSDQYDRADGLSREAVAIARRLGDPVTLAFALGERCHAIWGPDNPEERLELTGEILELARQAGKPRREMWARLWRLVALLELVRVEEADRELDRFAELAGGLRLASALFHVVAARVVRATLDGRFDEAERLAYQGIAQQWQSRNAEQDFAIQMFVIRRDLGRRAELEDTAVTLRALAMQYPGFRFLYRSMLAASTLEIGRHDEARRTLDELAAHDFADAHREFSWMTVMSLLGEVASDLGDVRRAAILYDLLTPYAARFPVLGWVGMALGSVSYPLGLLAATLGRTAAAVRHFEDALAMNRKVGARPYVIRTELAYGRLLAAGGEQARARALLDRAAAGAAELGMAGLVERAKVSLQSC